MGSLLGHKGVATWENAVVFSHSHDEVGNSGSWVTRAAAHSVKDDVVLQPYPRAVSRTAAAITLTSAGVPMVWQGEELLSNSDFKHGMPSTWGSDFSWVDFPVTPNRLDDFKRIASLPAPQKEQEKARMAPEERPLFEKYDAMPAAEKQQADVDSLRAGQYRLYQGPGQAPHIQQRPGRPHARQPRLHPQPRPRPGLPAGEAPGSDEFVVVSNFADMNRPQLPHRPAAGSLATGARHRRSQVRRERLRVQPGRHRCLARAEPAGGRHPGAQERSASRGAP